MSCKLCWSPLVVWRGRRIGEEVRKLLHDNLHSEVLGSLADEDEVCPECFSCFEALRGHYAELQRIQEEIQNVVAHLKSRLISVRNTARADSFDESSSAVTRTDRSYLKTSKHKRAKGEEVEDVSEGLLEEVKLEQKDSDYMRDSAEFCYMDERGSSSADEVVADVKEEVSDEDSMMFGQFGQFDDTTKFILSQLLSDSDSDFEIDKRKRKKPTGRKAGPKSKEACAVTNRNPKREPECELCEPKTIFPSVLALSQHFEMDHRNTEKVFFCEKFGCDEKLLTYDLLEIHNMSHHNYEGRERTGAPMFHLAYCNICQLSSHFPEELRNHELEAHLSMLKYACSICGAKYFSQDILDLHTLEHSEILEDLECSMCPEEWKFKFQDANSMESHLIRMHNFPVNSVGRKGVLKYSMKKRKRNQDGSLTCDKCGRVFKKRIRTHRCVGSPYKCELCKKLFEQKSVLTAHLVVRHEGEKNKSQWNPDLICYKCGKQFATTVMYKRHINCHNLESKLEFYCADCEQRFASEDLFSKHKKNRHHPETNSLKLSNLIKCEFCDKSYNNIVCIRRHEREVHPKAFVFLCTKCDATFAKSEFLETHLNTHEAAGPYGCSLCPKIFHSTGEELESHLKTAHTEGSGKTCPTCGEKFPASVELARHRSAKHGEPLPLECPHCKKGFCSPTDFRRHVEKCQLSEEMKRKKALEDRRQCEICKKWFAHQKSLNFHIKSVHEKATLRVCEVCGKSMNVGKTGMEDHMKIHREEKNFACEYCDKRFVRKDALRTHTYTHTGEKPLACYICDKRFNQHSPLKKHIETHKKDGTWFPKPTPFLQDESSNSNNLQ